jgi:CDP-diglyceride synthetase
MDTLSLFDPIVSQTIGFITGFFVITTTVHFVGSKLLKKKIEYSRYPIWLLFALTMFSAAFLGGIFQALIYSVIIYLGVIEIYRAGEAAGFVADKQSKGLALASASIFPLVLVTEPKHAILFLTLAVLAIFSVPVFQRNFKLASNKVTLAIFSLVFAALFSHLILIRSLAGGFGFTLFVVFITDAANSMGAVFGQLFGKRRYIPGVSPGKSLEGSLGSFLMTIIVAMILRFWVPGFTLSEIVAAAILICFFAQVGDLVFSVFKREVGIKDYSHILLEQGGILDQFDSMIYTAPIFFYFLKMLEYLK